MALHAVPGQQFDRIFSFEYDPAAKPAWVDMWDNGIVSWVVDDTGAAEPMPVTVGALPPPRTDTDPVKSPQWAILWGGGVIVPDQWRGSLVAFWTWLATNNGARRQIRGNFIGHGDVQNSWAAWAQANPNLVWPGP